MAGAPLRKLRREIRRLAAQVSRVQWFLRSPVQRALHDLRRDRLLSVTQGAAPFEQELALVLLHQTGGLLHSTFHMLDHLRSKGLSLLIVSNAPLSETDRDRLCQRAWRIIERPNFGYDFGGYRDGILHLLDEGIHPTRLFVMNDSVWFPLRKDSDLVDRARASKADLYGFSLNDARLKARHRHLQSYFLVFSGHLVGQDDFRAFWKRLFLSNDKDQVIRRCEIPLTGYFEARGHRVACRFEGGDGTDAAGALDDETLRAVLGYLAGIGAKNGDLLRQLHEAQTTDGAWRAQVLEAIAPGQTRLPLIRAHPAVLISQLDAPLLKKTRDARYRAQRAALLSLGLDSGFVPAVRDEIRHWDEGPDARMVEADN